MNTRRTVVAGMFYNRDAAGCAHAVDECVADAAPPAGLGRLFGGVVPHAGWMFSGPTAGKVFAAIKADRQPEVFVLFGAVHRGGGVRPAVGDAQAWATPLGEVPVDEDLRDLLLEEPDLAVVYNERAHEDEHSLEVQLPFIHRLFPKAAILPVATPPSRYAVVAGRAAADAVKKLGRDAVFIASSDLTHYGMNYYDTEHGPLPGALPWMKENDGRLIGLVEGMEAEEIVAEAARNRNACGAGAIAAAIAAARVAGADHAALLEYTTSMEVIGERRADSAVGYAGLVFHKQEAASAQ